MWGASKEKTPLQKHKQINKKLNGREKKGDREN